MFSSYLLMDSFIRVFFCFCFFLGGVVLFCFVLFCFWCVGVFLWGFLCLFVVVVLLLLLWGFLFCFFVVVGGFFLFLLGFVLN